MIIVVVGTRPNFVKVAPLIRELDDYVLVNTGQHYDYNMSEGFFKGLNVPEPHHNLNVGSSPHGIQTGNIMCMFEPLCEKLKPSIVVVIGDVNSTLACGIVASKMNGVKLAHIESGERSGDRSMPEEINRILVDSVSDYLFCSNAYASINLIHEGVPIDKMYTVGNIVIDNLIQYKDRIERQPYPSHTLFTLHRPFNTDNRDRLKSILDRVNGLKYSHVLFPMHPRTRVKVEEFGLRDSINNIEVVEPLGYLEFMGMLNKAGCVITDSGGIQVEAAYYGVPCITLRDNTEHIYTIEKGHNTLVGNDMDRMESVFYSRTSLKPIRTELDDGKVAKRISQILYKGE